MAKRPVAHPVPEPASHDAYMDLFGRCVEAKTPEALVSLMAEIVTYEGGRFEDDFKRQWLSSWYRLGKTMKDIPPWPRGGPFSRHAGPS
jgi:hypothetical protein